MDNEIYKELLNIADDMGIIILDDMLTIKGMEGFYVDNGSMEFITLNVSLKDYPKRRNFVLAHELGHKILHGNMEEEIELKEVEEEANNYASNLINEIAQRVGRQAIA